ncbi:response regulator transcription factor [Sphingomonas sp. CL5.1]|uniref:response regulator transcription factor n=1 Tax=Sphingomonas sp. CL5.1 TaxID=2653203 RepID=UPI001581E187|nr:response regulator transcription factor [Sphingomonas sp. CL5.1]QKS00409.1 response regulator transcription factor [Sphingomonas sp. CL5.1]
MRVLLVEDDAETAALIVRGLGEAGHEVQVVTRGDEALAVNAGAHDLAIIDRMLPGLDGLEVVRRWRAEAVRTPVLMLTALGSIGDRVFGLSAGADDYLVKPFALAELSARVGALLRRPPFADTPTRFQVGDVTLDLLRREVRRSGNEVRLQPREFGILEQLMRNAGRIVTRTMLLETVWGFHFDPQTNIVESHLSRMRGKLNEGFDSDPIETVRGVGYRMRGHD